MQALPAMSLGLLVLLGLCVEPAFALGLGAAQLKSALGQPLNLIIPVTSATSAELDGGCFALVGPGRDDSGVPSITKAKLTLQHRDDTAFLRLTTSYAINDPVVAFAIESRCIGVVKREYMVLLDMVSPVEAPVAPEVTLTNSAVKVTATPPRANKSHTPHIKSTAQAPAHHISSVSDQIVTTTPALRLSTDLQWLPGQHQLTTEQLSDLKRMRGKLSIDAGGDTSTVDDLRDDIVATQKQLAQAKQELAQIRSQTAQAHQVPDRAQNPHMQNPATKPAFWPAISMWVWILVAGLVIALLAYLFRRQRKLPDFNQVATAYEPGSITQPHAATDSHAATSAVVDAGDDLGNDFFLGELPGQTMLGSKTDMAKMASDSLSVSNLMRVTEEAEVFLELGYPDRAIKVLTDDIATHPRSRPAVWLMLLGIYRQQENRPAFDEALVAFNADFNLASPTWDDIAQPEQEGEGLFAMPHVLSKIVTLWPSHECHDYLSELLYDDRQGTRQGFRLDVYRDIIWLREVLAVLSQPESQIAEDVAANDLLDWDL
ncbi:MAG: hypothetical protein WC426_12730 [Sulfuriferula sp.]